jgi:hypothetical protein
MTAKLTAQRIEKRCGTCGGTKPLEEFNVMRRSPDGRQARCRECQQRINREWKDRHRSLVNLSTREWARLNPERAREHHFLRRYGITLAQYEWLLRQQDGVCAICSQPCATGKNLAVDHDHVTGAVRGLLCDRCNHAIGSLEDDPGRADQAAAYLRARRPHIPELESVCPPIKKVDLAALRGQLRIEEEETR